MSKQANYDTKSSIFSLDYKIPYDICESQRIVEHLEESQCELEFLKEKLSQTYMKLEEQIKANIQLNEFKEKYQSQLQQVYDNWHLEQIQNRKLKEVMEKIIKNRKLIEEDLQYTQKKYKKLLQEKEERNELQIMEYERKISQNERKIRLLQHENQLLNDKMASECERNSKSLQLQDKIQILQNQIKRITNEKVTEINRLRHELQCYKTYDFSSAAQTHRSIRPSKKRNKFQVFFDEDNHSEYNNENVNILQKNIKETHEHVIDSKVEESIGKWKKSNVSSVKGDEITDDQKLTQYQIQRKRVESQLCKMERLKRPNQSDRELMENLEKKIYNIDSEISGLKRKIRQKY